MWGEYVDSTVAMAEFGRSIRRIANLGILGQSLHRWRLRMNRPFVVGVERLVGGQGQRGSGKIILGRPALPVDAPPCQHGDHQSERVTAATATMVQRHPARICRLSPSWAVVLIATALGDSTASLHYCICRYNSYHQILYVEYLVLFPKCCLTANT